MRIHTNRMESIIIVLIFFLANTIANSRDPIDVAHWMFATHSILVASIHTRTDDIRVAQRIVALSV